MNQSVPATPFRLFTASLVVCAILALANLPAAELPVGWLLAFTLPAAILGRQKRSQRAWRRAVWATLLQTTACLIALEFSQPPTRPAALACTILPPLAFVTARQQDADGALGLFLSFCVLLVGVILDGIHAPLVIGYGAAACLALRCAAHLAARAVGRVPAHAAARERTLLVLPASALALLVPCLLTAFLIDRTIGVLPTLSRAGGAGERGDQANDRRRSAGLDDSFVLDGGGLLSGMAGEQLVRVHTSDGAAVPHDLYLRSGFFAVPGLDRWQLGLLEQAPAANGEAHALRRPLPRTPVTWLEIERFSGARNFVFVPPGATEVRGLPDLLVDPAREWVRQREGTPLDIYEVAFQTPKPPTDDVALDPRARRLGLLSLPNDFDRAPFEALLREWGTGERPLQALAAITDGLATHCRYDRIEPVGPYPHKLQNFLFADGDRRGYCMHFASAAALMLRLRGIPCRIGVGLYGGDPDRRDPTARIYGSQHAHAWVEVPFEGRGYVVFDPTPAAERGSRMPSQRDQSQLGAQPKKKPGDRDVGFVAGLFAFFTQPWVIVLLALVAGTLLLRPKDTARDAEPATTTPMRNARRLLARLLQTLREVGHPRRRGETLETYARSLAARQRLLPQVQAAFVTYQEVRFGGRPFDGERARILQLGLDAAAGMAPLAELETAT